MIKVYKQSGAIIVSKVGEDLVYLNTDDTRVLVRGDAFLLNEGQTNRTVDLGKYSDITDANGAPIGTKDDCWAYLVDLNESSFGLSVTEGVFARKVVEMNTDETYHKITFYDDADLLLKTQEIKEGANPSTSIDPTKTIEITNSYV